MTTQHRLASTPSSSTKGIPSGLTFSYFCLVLSVVLLLIVFAIYLDTTSPCLTSLGYGETEYAVIIDAGSTGSRVLTYKAFQSFIDGKLILSDELFKEKNPRLSSFADNPSKARAL